MIESFLRSIVSISIPEILNGFDGKFTCLIILRVRMDTEWLFPLDQDLILKVKMSL